MRLKKSSLKSFVEKKFHQSVNNIDGHIHTVSSPDATLTISDIIKEAKENKLSYIAITDHNTCVGVDSYMRSLGLKDREIYFEQDGVKVVCGAEVTCFYEHSTKNQQKLHILCYGFSRNPHNSFMRLLKDKYEDYLETFYTIPETLVNYGDDVYGSVYSRNDFKNFMFNKRVLEGKNTHNNYFFEEVITYFSSKGINADKIQQDMNNLSHMYKFQDNIHLDINDVIKAVHNAGGKCMVAHPLKSFKKFSEKHNHTEKQRWEYAKEMTNTLLGIGVDGVELISDTNNNVKANYNMLYKNVGFTSYGSDKHDNLKGPIPLGRLNGYNPPCNFKFVIEQLQNEHMEKLSNSTQKLTKNSSEMELHV